MIIVSIILGVMLLVSLGYIATHVYKGPKPEALPEPTSNPRLPTRNERWVMENEHELYPDTSFNHKGCRVCGPGPLARYEVPSTYDHVYYKDVVYSKPYGGMRTSREKVSGPSEANCVSSQIEGTKYHTIMLDIDHACRVVESSTPGHHHLYIDVPITWLRYIKLLRQLYKARIIERGYYAESLRRKATHLRPPWTEKEGS